MAKSIDDCCNQSLSDLEIVPGQIVAFDNRDIEYPQPFILAIPEKLVKGHRETSSGIQLVYWADRADSSKREEWTLYTKGKMMGLWPPKSGADNKKKPAFHMMDEWGPHGNAYVVEKAYSGKEAIQMAFQNYNGSFNFYADCMKNGKLVTERGMFGEIFEKIGLETLLPNRLRFR